MKRDEGIDTGLESVRARIQSTRGKDYWRSLEELADTEEFHTYLHNEFPGLEARWSVPLNRRDVLKLMGASLALAGLSACAIQPAEKIVPYVHPPKDFVPGKPLYYATAMTLQGYARGLLVESHMGRPTKVEGNPHHPASLGGTGPFEQASVLNLYDPDRAQTPIQSGRVAGWSLFIDAMNQAAAAQRLSGGAGMRILTETVTSPLLYSRIRSLLETFPRAKWHQYEPAGINEARVGSRLAFGGFMSTRYRLERADVILALDANFLTSGPGWIRYARDWAGRRQKQNMNRLYVVETHPTGTGAAADHRLALSPSDVDVFARQVARALQMPVPEAGRSAAPAEWIAALVKDLQQHRGSSLVIAGDCQPAHLHVLAHAMNEALGNVGSTVFYTDPVEPEPADQFQSLRELTGEMNAGAVDLLMILGGNPAFNAPADLNFAAALSRVNNKIRLGLQFDETSSLCNWHLPETHYLEMWGDARAFDGTATIIQPLIAPLYQGKSACEVLSIFQDNPGQGGYDLVRDYWRGRTAGKDFDEFWHDSLNSGVVADSAFAPRTVRMQEGWASRLPAPASPASGLQISFRPDPCIFDGRFINNGWLQELPKPISKLTWDNAIFLSPSTARRLQLASRDVVELQLHGQSVRAPVWVLPAQAPDCMTIYFGYGRTVTGKVGMGTGFNAYPFRSSEAPWSVSGAELRKTGDQMVLACTELHHTMEGRNLVRVGTLAEYNRDPMFVHKLGEAPAAADTLYPGFDYSKGYQWAMAVNLGACVGCNACVIACESENNTPVVGKHETNNMRQMQWLRIDRYYTGDEEDPSMVFAPVLCMHCENAPCELVCPVQATNHSSEGLNQMIYNRCVGTRYCSNNCPYKVRRFNFLQFSDWGNTASLIPMRNPDVTVRGRGVMEKCTYCVQRIQEAKIHAEKEDRLVRDGEILTACQQACPTQVFAFGNINDPGSRVARLRNDSLNYQMLAELNVRPRTSYLARLRNPNNEIEKE